LSTYDNSTRQCTSACHGTTPRTWPIP
jgi:hypothetical protein